ncbi:hypothetical protein [Nitrososphaera sp. AFS]|uniref:hypothetical protein n=1 Tax=Nitrososphaera sp. AFS TaxID=2301191 RepID=UPI001F23B26D|nr:hypothetical protein [Nitrososphaera sp. AFS]
MQSCFTRSFALTCGTPIPSVSNVRAITTDTLTIAATMIAIADIVVVSLLAVIIK